MKGTAGKRIKKGGGPKGAPPALSLPKAVPKATDNDYATVVRSRDEYVSLAEAAIFQYAFKLGMQIAIEALTE